VLRIVVVAGGEGIETPSKAVDGRVKVEIIIIGEDNMEIAV
jgi:hypothetical protein